MTLDQHRYGATIVLDRWAALADRLRGRPGAGAGPRDPAASPRPRAGRRGPARTSQPADRRRRADTEEVVSACVLAYQSLDATFQAERTAAQQAGRLGPMLPEDYRQARRIFLEDLAAR